MRFGLRKLWSIHNYCHKQAIQDLWEYDENYGEASSLVFGCLRVYEKEREKVRRMRTKLHFVNSK